MSMTEIMIYLISLFAFIYNLSIFLVWNKINKEKKQFLIGFDIAIIGIAGILLFLYGVFNSFVIYTPYDFFKL